jgi:hypothetical protein
MRYFIDVNNCCQDGLSLIWDKWKAWEASDHRALLKLRSLESDHLSSCTKCNPTLMVDGFFSKVGPVEVK